MAMSSALSSKSNTSMFSRIRDGVTDYSFIPQRLVTSGYILTLLREEEVNLETAFMRLTKGMVQ